MRLPHPWFTKADRRQLLLNGQRSAAGKDIDPLPVVKLFIPDGAATWLVAMLDRTEPTRAFGLCDLGLGSPELGTIDLNELARLRGYLKLPVSRDIYFQPQKPLSAYAADARAAGRITV